MGLSDILREKVSSSADDKKPKGKQKQAKKVKQATVRVRRYEVVVSQSKGKRTKILLFIDLFEKLRNALSLRDKENMLRNFPYQKSLKTILAYAMSHHAAQCFTLAETLIEPKRQAAFDFGDRRFKYFVRLLRTSNAKDKATLLASMSKIMVNVNTREYEFYDTIMRCHVEDFISPKTVNLLYPKMLKYPNGFMLAEKYSAKHDIEFPIWAEPKIPGIRMKLWASPDGMCGAYTINFRNHRELFRQHLDYLCEVAKKKNMSVEIDGVIFFKSFTQTCQLMAVNSHGKHQPTTDAKSKLIFYAFDYILNGNCKVPLEERKNRLLGRFIKMSKALPNATPQIKVMPHTLLKSTEEIALAFSNAIKSGYKGIILKDSQDFYHSECSETYHLPKRCTSWLTVSDMVIKKAVIKEFVFTKESSLCSILVEVESIGETVLHSIPDAIRKWLIDNKYDVIGKVCEIEYDTQDGDETTLTNPRFLRARWDI